MNENTNPIHKKREWLTPELWDLTGLPQTASGANTALVELYCTTGATSRIGIRTINFMPTTSGGVQSTSCITY